MKQQRRERERSQLKKNRHVYRVIFFSLCESIAFAHREGMKPRIECVVECVEEAKQPTQNIDTIIPIPSGGEAGGGSICAKMLLHENGAYTPSPLPLCPVNTPYGF